MVSLLWGAGKTLTSIEAALAIRNQSPPTTRLPILVLTDVSTVEDWSKNAREHYRPGLSLTFVSGKARVDSSAAVMNWHTLSKQDIIVTNVEILVGFYATAYARRRELIQRALLDVSTSIARRSVLTMFLQSGAERMNVPIPDTWLANEEICRPTTDARYAMFYTEWPVIIIDEAHKVRNSESGWFTVLSQLRDGFRISLTATPFNNSIKDVVSVLAITNIAPPSRCSARRYQDIIEEWTSVMESPIDFCADFTTARDRYIVQGGDNTTIDREHYRPVDMIVRVPFDTEEEKEHYRLLSTRCDGNMLKLAVRLKQACSGIFENDSADEVWPVTASIIPTKIRAVLRYLDVTTARNEKVNIMCEYRASLDQLRMHINAHFGTRLTVYTVDGSTSAVDRQKIRTLYEQHRGAAVLVVTSIFNQGVNLHCANHTILFSTQWNPVVADQSRSRCERPGQTRSVFSLQLIIANTIEDQIWTVAATKRQTNREVMLGDVTSELLQRVTDQDDEQTSIDEQLRRVALLFSTERMMRENCTHFIDSIDALRDTIPATIPITPITSSPRPHAKRMSMVSVVVDGRVVARRLH